MDPAADAVRYVYDEVGNILSVEKQASSQVWVIEFTPNGGPEGTSVTIYGTGFSTTASENSVQFNGVS